MSDPWAEPSRPAAPYAGPPPTVPVAHPPYGSAPPYWNGQSYGYPPAGYGYPGPWGPAPPSRPRRPGQVITVSVLSFVQAGLVFFASLYVWMLTSIADVARSRLSSATVAALVTEGTVLAIVQLVSAVVLVVAGAFALTRRTRAAWLVVLGAQLAQVALALYWAVRLQVWVSDVPGPSPGAAFSAFALFFAAGPLVALGLVVFGPGRRWFDGTART
jgi:hypothetical protein